MAEMARQRANEIIATHRPAVELSDEVKASLRKIVADAEAEVARHPGILE